MRIWRSPAPNVARNRRPRGALGRAAAIVKPNRRVLFARLGASAGLPAFLRAGQGFPCVANHFWYRVEDALDIVDVRVTLSAKPGPRTAGDGDIREG